MAFMNSGTAEGGEFKVYVSYNAKAGRWYTKRDGKDEPQFEVTDMTAIFDMDNLQTGWFLFAPGVAPVKHMDPSLAQAMPCPGEGFKRGFQIDLYSEKNLLGVREFSATAGIVIDAMNSLHDQWMAQAASNVGKLPVVKCVGVTPVTNKHGTNYKPQLEIVAWADRPTALAGASAPAAPAAPAAPTSVAPPPAAHVPPPTASAAADSVEF